MNIRGFLLWYSLVLSQSGCSDAVGFPCGSCWITLVGGDDLLISSLNGFVDRIGVL